MEVDIKITLSREIARNRDHKAVARNVLLALAAQLVQASIDLENGQPAERKNDATAG